MVLREGWWGPSQRASKKERNGKRRGGDKEKRKLEYSDTSSFSNNAIYMNKVLAAHAKTSLEYDLHTFSASLITIDQTSSCCSFYLRGFFIAVAASTRLR